MKNWQKPVLHLQKSMIVINITDKFYIHVYVFLHVVTQKLENYVLIFLYSKVHSFYTQNMHQVKLLFIYIFLFNSFISKLKQYRISDKNT